MPLAGEVVLASDVAIRACRVDRGTSNLAIAHNTDVTIAFTEEAFDTDGMHSTVTNNSRITIQTAGVYVVGFSGTMIAGSDYTFILATVQLNGGTPIARQQIPGTSASVPQRISMSTVYQFVVGDYIEVLLLQRNGASTARTLEGLNEVSPVFYAARISS